MMKFKTSMFLVVTHGALLMSTGCKTQREQSSTESARPQAGDTIVLGVDWERIDKGLKTGDFSCRGTCATAQIDWNEIWQTVSGKKYSDRKKSNTAFCISGFQQYKNSLVNIDSLVQQGTITEDRASDHKLMQNNTLETTELACEGLIGERETQNLKSGILGSNIKPKTDQTFVNWEGIEQHMQGNFSARLDWNNIWQTVSGKKQSDQKKNKIAMCISGFQEHKNNLAEIDGLLKQGTITAERASAHKAMQKNALETVEIACEGILGKRETQNLKSSILGNLR